MTWAYRNVDQVSISLESLLVCCTDNHCHKLLQSILKMFRIASCDRFLHGTINELYEVQNISEREEVQRLRQKGKRCSVSGRKEEVQRLRQKSFIASTEKIRSANLAQNLTICCLVGLSDILDDCVMRARVMASWLHMIILKMISCLVLCLAHTTHHLLHLARARWSWSVHNVGGIKTGIKSMSVREWAQLHSMLFYCKYYIYPILAILVHVSSECLGSFHEVN